MPEGLQKLVRQLPRSIGVPSESRRYFLHMVDDRPGGRTDTAPDVECFGRLFNEHSHSICCACASAGSQRQKRRRAFAVHHVVCQRILREARNRQWSQALGEARGGRVDEHVKTSRAERSESNGAEQIPRGDFFNDGFSFGVRAICNDEYFRSAIQQRPHHAARGAPCNG